MAAKKSGGKGGKVEKVMHEYKQGQLKSGGKKKVSSRKQAVAIALSEARGAGENVAPKKKASGGKTTRVSKAKTKPVGK
jgi:hypothetical protein